MLRSAGPLIGGDSQLHSGYGFCESRCVDFLAMVFYGDENDTGIANERPAF